MLHVESWHKCVHGTMTIRNQDTSTAKTIKNQRKRKVETLYYTKLILRVTGRNLIHDTDQETDSQAQKLIATFRITQE